MRRQANEWAMVYNMREEKMTHTCREIIRGWGLLWIYNEECVGSSVCSVLWEYHHYAMKYFKVSLNHLNYEFKTFCSICSQIKM